MRTFTRWMHNEKPSVAGLVLGACIAGFLGGVAGLIVGLDAYAPTAWAATFELGIPAAMVGGTLGACLGLIKDARCTRSREAEHRHMR